MSENFIILSFPRFAGGKFISNCLSLSRYCCPQDLTTAEYLLTNPEDYDFRLRTVMSTLPPTRSKMINWISQYEFGDREFYGPDVLQWKNGICQPPNKLIKLLLDANFKLFLVAHGGDLSVRNLLKVWPKATVIKFVNHVKFSTISKKLKSNNNIELDQYAGNYCKTKYESLAGMDWPSWHEFESSGYNANQFILTHPAQIIKEMREFYPEYNTDTQIIFDVDSCIFNQYKFLTSMEALYQKLNFDDFNADLITKFWQAYIDLHIDKHQNM